MFTKQNNKKKKKGYRLHYKNLTYMNFLTQAIFLSAKGKLFAAKGMGTVRLQEDLSAVCGNNKPGLRSCTTGSGNNDWEGHSARRNTWDRKWEHEETCKQFMPPFSLSLQLAQSSQTQNDATEVQLLNTTPLRNIKNSDSSSQTCCQHQLGTKSRK